MSIYRLYGTGTVSADNIASLDIRADGHIVCWAISGFVGAATVQDEGAMVELSFGSTRAFTTNDVQNVIATMAIGLLGVVTTGGGNMTGSDNMAGLRIPVAAGERIYMHVRVDGTCTFVGWATLHVEDGIDGATRPSARRRG